MSKDDMKEFMKMLKVKRENIAMNKNIFANGMIKSKKKQVHRTILRYLMDLNILCIIISKHSSKLFQTLKQFPIPSSETLKQSIGEGTKNWRIDGLTLHYLMTRGERKSELLEEVIPASWCLVGEVSKPRCLGFRQFSAGGKKKRELERRSVNH